MRLAYRDIGSSECSHGRRLSVQAESPVSTHIMMAPAIALVVFNEEEGEARFGDPDIVP